MDMEVSLDSQIWCSSQNAYRPSRLRTKGWGGGGTPRGRWGATLASSRRGNSECPPLARTHRGAGAKGRATCPRVDGSGLNIRMGEQWLRGSIVVASW
jgi:hypothetical protein